MLFKSLVRFTTWISPLIILAGCSTSRQVTSRAPFDPNAASYIHQRGEANLKGEAYLRNPDTNKIVYASGEIVRLIPATPYAQDRFHQIYGDRQFVAISGDQYVGVGRVDVDPTYAQYTKTVRTD